MNKPSQKYWQDRFEELSKNAYKLGDLSHKDLQNIFKQTSKEITEQVDKFFYKYGVVAESPTFTTLADGSQVVSGTSKKLTVPISEALKPLAKGNRLIKLEGQLKEYIKDLTVKEKALFTSTLTGVAEDVYYTSIYEIYKGLEIGTSFNLLNKSTIKALIENPINGKTWINRATANGAKFYDNVTQILRGGITQGLSNGQMARRLLKQSDIGYKNAKRLIDTEVTNTLNQAAMESYKASGVVNKYQFLATLDNRTSEICAELDNQVFPLDKAVTGLNQPPMHVNCRSTTRAYFDKSYEAATRIARNEDGKTFLVPGDMTYKEFAKKYITK